MKNKITKLAIAKAGGVDALARKLKIKQPSVSAWYRVPAGRCIAVEGITGISRYRLRPDVFGKAP